MPTIHPTALVDARAELDTDVQVGPYAIVGPHVRVGAGTTVGAHAVLEGHTTLGRDNRVFQFASLGAAPQDKKYADEPTALRIGDRNTFREFVTINRGTVQDRHETTIGSDNWIMAYVHIAHDCVVGDHAVFANSTNLAGHVHVGDWAVLGGFTGVHQHCKVGAHVMTGVGSVILHDVPPFVTCAGNTAAAHGINAEGLRRRGFAPEAIAAIRRAYRTLYKSGLTLDEARAALRQQGAGDAPGAAHVAALAAFLDTVTRGIVR